MEAPTRLRGGSPTARRWPCRLIKRLVRTGADQDLTTALDMVASEMTVVRSSDDHKEALAAFKDKRKPAFKGK
jgi:enoyl-CoA hydratase/carnithine racemase